MSEFWDIDDIDNSLDDIAGCVSAIAATLGTIAVVGTVIACTVIGEINRSKLEKEMKEKGIQQAFIKMIDKCTNTITLEDLINQEEIEIHGDSISDDLCEGEELSINDIDAIPNVSLGFVRW